MLSFAQFRRGLHRSGNLIAGKTMRRSAGTSI
jgi:hypothetical protein